MTQGSVIHSTIDGTVALSPSDQASIYVLSDLSDLSDLSIPQVPPVPKRAEKYGEPKNSPNR